MSTHDDLPTGAPPLEKEAMLARIRDGRAALEGALRRLSEPQLMSPGPDTWAVKDHLVHIAAWERGIAALLRKQPRHAAMGLDRETYLRGAQAVNDTLHARHRDDSLATARETFRAAHEEILAAIASLETDGLRRTYSHYQPDEPGKETGAPIAGWVAGNTYEHYAEHQGWIESLVARS